MIRWLKVAGTTALGITLAALAVVAAFTLLLALLVRDIPDLGSAATDFVTDIATSLDVPEDQADELAAMVVGEVDQSLLGGSIAAASQVRLIVRLIPLVPLIIIAIAVAVSGRGNRRRWTGWATLWFGLALIGYAAVLRWAADGATTPLSEAGQAVARAFVGRLFGPTWVIGFACLIGGLVLFVTTLRRPTPAS